MRDINLKDFVESLKKVRRSVPQESLVKYANWNANYGDMSV
jgi:spastin